MRYGFEAEIRDAEITINALIRTVMNNGGKVYLSDRDNVSFAVELTQPISLIYWIPRPEPPKVE